ncbi:hypothetical protein RRG08_062144 [Elysia crispata]|uniref:Uncharacterized protein n=1 Tax=Elysia crispata TaxID=231223 RepID=A0AAE1D1K1_9GAST|nr:hypothetical protein RRG08_062144 [Elysia crispata]
MSGPGVRGIPTGISGPDRPVSRTIWTCHYKPLKSCFKAWQTSKEPGPIRPKRNLRREPNLNILVADRLPYMACSY